jgi:uncharacterized 2Fe-2S/4Fe-4S cluster protein (DUF4445 family)
MLGKEVLVKFRPSGKEAYVLPGTRLVEAAADAGLVLEVPCGGEGLCGRCRVLTLSGAAEPTAAEQEWLSNEELQAGWRLACQSSVHGPMEVEIPADSGSAVEHQILVDTHLPTNRKLPSPFGRGAGGEGLDGRDESIFPDSPHPTDTVGLAVAMDIGTTTLVGSLLDLGTGNELAIEARLNPQTRLGDDVLSRILYSRKGPAQLRELQATISTVIDEMIGALCKKVGIARERICEISFAGNTTMQQMLRGIDSSALGESPFTPASYQAATFSAEEIGLHISPGGQAYVMPVIGGFVGGDTVAGILSTGIAAEAEGPTLLVDIGTNGEIVLQAGGKLRAASTAAGPAFEGARISCGMRGCTGAIEKVLVEDGRLGINVIGNVPPVGLCGSGLIDVAAELLRHQILTPQGRLQTADQVPADTPPDLKQRIVLHEGRVAFQLASAEETAGEPIVLTQRDLRELQLATGAIRAGVVILLRQAGLEPKDLHRVLIGGGFGNFIRRSNAQRIGLLPHEIEHRRIRYMGNTSLAGARLAALSMQSRQQAEEFARRTEHVELSNDRAFHEVFADSMLFPEE